MKQSALSIQNVARISGSTMRVRVVL